MIKYMGGPLVQEIDYVQCDVCRKKFYDDADIDEFLHLDRFGGNKSVFGDSVLIQCDICQNCQKKLFGKYIRVESVV